MIDLIFWVVGIIITVGIFLIVGVFAIYFLITKRSKSGKKKIYKLEKQKEIK